MSKIKNILLSILAVLAFSAFFITPFFIKVKIVCKSQFGDCPNEVSTALQKINSKNLYAAKKDISKTLKADNLISDFSTQYKLPNILEINILVKKPDFALYNKNTSEYFIIDADGTVLSKVSQTTLPRVVVDSSPILGQKIDDNTLTALKIIQGVWEMYQIGTGEIDSDGLIVDLSGGIQVIFPVDGDPNVLLGALRLIYTKITTGDMTGKYSQIDLRFKNPVLR